jgi:Mg/Co/Ni transporter MgtE
MGADDMFFLLDMETTTRLDIMVSNLIEVADMDDQAEVVRLAKQYGFLVVPVVDAFRKMVGIVSVNDVVDSSRSRPPRTSSASAAWRPSSSRPSPPASVTWSASAPAG